jgi:hypothetical protein
VRTFQLTHNGKRVARLIVNCHADPADIAESLLAATISFRLAVRWGELENKTYCGLEEFEHTSPRTGAHLEVYHVQEGGEDA